MTEGRLRGGPGIEVSWTDEGCCYITGKWGSKIEIDPEDMGRLIHLLTLAIEMMGDGCGGEE